MIRRTAVVLALLATALTALSAQRVSFVRTIPAAHDLGGDDVALIYAVGDTRKVEVFAETFAEHVNRSGLIRLQNVAATDPHFVGVRPDAESWARVRKEKPADVYLGVTRFTCGLTDRTGIGSTRDFNGDRVKVQQAWADAVCTGRINILDAETAKRVASFEVRGEGTSPRVGELTNEERNIALDQAARYAAIAAAEEVTPRRQKESVELDDRAPAYDEATALIDGSQLNAARERLESALKNAANSAALHYNIAALCEALGDTAAAETHYQEALRLAPDDSRYRAEALAFRRRWRKH